MKQPRGLELSRALQRAYVDRVEPAVAGERRDLALRVRVVAGEQHVELVTGDCSRSQRDRECGIERLHPTRPAGQRRQLLRGGAVGRHHEPVEGLVHGVGDVYDDLPGDLVGVLLSGAESVRVVHRQNDHVALDRIAAHRRLDRARPGDVAGDRLGALEVLADDGEVMTARARGCRCPAPCCRFR